MTLPIPEAARRLGRDPETLRRWIRSGRLPARKLGTQYFVEVHDLPETAAPPVPRPAWLQRTRSGEPMPDILALLRRQRAEH